jgi:hypothetical protein
MSGTPLLAKGGDNAQLKEQLKDWAGKTIPMLKHHLDMAEGLEEWRVYLRAIGRHPAAFLAAIVYTALWLTGPPSTWRYLS